MIKQDTIEKTARLARLKLDSAESEKILGQLQKIISYFEMIEQVETSKVEPLLNPNEDESKYRKDEVIDWMNKAQALELAPEKLGSLFKVPPII